MRFSQNFEISFSNSKPTIYCFHINSINSLQQIETKIEIKENEKQTESQTQVKQMDVIIIDENESQVSSHLKPNQFK